jgi:hypothetical protein
LELFVAVLGLYCAFYLGAKAVVPRHRWLSIPALRRMLYVFILLTVIVSVLTLGFKMGWLDFGPNHPGNKESRQI